MPRRSSGGRSGRGPVAKRSPPRPARHEAPAPAPAQRAPGGGFGSAIVDGLAFGGGTAIAHRAVDAVMGPRTIQHETTTSQAVGAPPPAAASMGGSDACAIHSKAFHDCLNSNGSDISKCQFYVDMLTECRRSSGAVMSS